jgi:hypothetical protein
MHRLGLPVVSVPAISETMILDSPSVKSERPAKRLHLRAHPADAGPNPLAVLSLQPQLADAVWTRGEWTALCEHLHNDNGKTHFVMGFRDADGCKKYVRSKRLPVERAISWAWSSLAGAPKSRLAFVPYSTNGREQSRWGGMDFDAHIVYGYLRPYLNKVWLAEFDGLCSVDQYVFKVDATKADTIFVSSFMRSPVYLQRAPTSVMQSQLPRIRTEEVASVELNLPPLRDQRRIAAQLSSQMAAAERLRQMLAEQLDAINKLPAALLRRAFNGEP